MFFLYLFTKVRCCGFKSWKIIYYGNLEYVIAIKELATIYIIPGNKGDISESSRTKWTDGPRVRMLSTKKKDKKAT